LTAKLTARDGVVLTQTSATQLAAGATRNVPILIGCNDEEARLYFIPSGAIDRIPEWAIGGMVARSAVSRFGRAMAEQHLRHQP